MARRFIAAAIALLVSIGASNAEVTREVLRDQALGQIPRNVSGTLVYDPGAGAFYGMTFADSVDNGTVFSLKPNGEKWDYKVVWAFNGLDGYTGSAGNDNLGNFLSLDADGNLFGTAAGGGDPTCRCGAVFKLTRAPSDEWSFTPIHGFTGATNGALPSSPLLSSETGETLYGTVANGGQGGNGLIYSLTQTPDGWDFAIVHTFEATLTGNLPIGPLVRGASGTIFGSTMGGGPGTRPGGTIYRLNPKTRAVKTLHVFRDESSVADEGYSPLGLAGSETTLYGVTKFGASGPTAFRIETSGKNFKVVARFPERAGVLPNGDLLVDDAGAIHGTARAGGLHPASTYCTFAGCGTVFKLTPKTKGFALEATHRFRAGRDGFQPFSGLTRGPDPQRLYGVSYTLDESFRRTRSVFFSVAAPN